MATVRLWGSDIGAVALTEDDRFGRFEYDRAFARAAPVQPSPVHMPVADGRVYTFPNLDPDAFHRLPGMLADSLPDRYGNALIDAWLEAQGRAPGSFDAVERLCYVGQRGMGALEFEPEQGPAPVASVTLDVTALADLAARVLSDRSSFVASLADEDRSEAMLDILAVGTSAGGARAKAVIAYDPATGEVRSGQVAAPDGFEHWLLKFDGVRGSGDHGLQDPEGYGRIEHAYAAMARAAGIAMTDTRLLKDGPRRHFMTRRFDRTDSGGKLHMQSLGGLMHLDYNQPRAHAYEQALTCARRLGMASEDLADAQKQLVLRAIFNVVARNQDDHVKNVAYLMDRTGRWTLAPAYDVTYAYDPTNRWMAEHQMSISGKRDWFTLADLDALGATAPLPRGRARSLYEQVREAVTDWPAHAEQVGVPEADVRRIGASHRLHLPAR